MSKKISFIPQQSMEREITLRVIIVSLFLTVILASSNCFLALKIGYLTSASIPAAILSIGILRFFKNTSVLENNLVQTSASAGEAIAGGIAYTAPALIIIHYWIGFDYVKTFLLALTSGVLGVLFSTPLRRFLVTEKNLTFPEGKAIAEVLKAGSQKNLGLKEILWGSGAGAFLELAQAGFQLIASGFQYWFFVGASLWGFGIGFSATLVGAGYLMGFQIALSLLVGAILGFGIGIPLFTYLHPISHSALETSALATQIWQDNIRYVGIGAMLFAGIWTLAHLTNTLLSSLKIAINHALKKQFRAPQPLLRTEKDLPTFYILAGILSMLTLLYWVLQSTVNLDLLGIPAFWHVPFLLSTLVYLTIIGFIFAAICGYFSGLVGVSATPGSAIVIVGFLLSGTILKALQGIHPAILSATLQECIAATILSGCVITGISAIANDNIQDLKAGHLVGATPWKQQAMLLFGALIAAAVIPFLMQLLFSVYGIGNVLPNPSMDPSHALAAPPAMMMATLAQSVFQHALPWNLMLTGALLIVLFIFINRYFLPKKYELSLLGIGIGIYLPITTSVPLFVGGLFAFIVNHWFMKQTMAVEATQTLRQKPVLLACGLVSGAAMMDVILAIPFALTQNVNILRLTSANFPKFVPHILGLLSLIGLGLWFYRMVAHNKGITKT